VLLLWNILRFLGQEPPQGLKRADCRAFLQWGITHFDAARIPLTGGELQVS
jgi:hypothetical protein